MAELDSSHGELPHRDAVTSRTATIPATSSPAKLTRRDVRRLTQPELASDKPKMKPLRMVGTVFAIAALIGGVAVPAYAAFPHLVGNAPTALEAAQAQAQTVDVSAGVQSDPLSSSSYSATTIEEIEEIEAAQAAAVAAQARLLEQQRQLQQQQSGSGSPSQSGNDVNYTPAPAINGLVNPLPAGTYSLGDGIEATWRNHQGQDMLAPAYTPIYAVADGTVSSAGYSGGYGNVVYVQHSIDGNAVESRYGHMVEAPAVSAGQVVTAGQLLGYVGSTGRSTANHLHIEIRVNGAVVDPRSYLPI